MHLNTQAVPYISIVAVRVGAPASDHHHQRSALVRSTLLGVTEIIFRSHWLMSTRTSGSQQLGGDHGFSKSSWTALGRNPHSLKVTDVKAISDQDQIVVVHCHCYQRSKHTRSQRLDRNKLPGLKRVILEFNRNVRGDVTVVGEANVQRGVWNNDAVILIVSRRR